MVTGDFQSTPLSPVGCLGATIYLTVVALVFGLFFWMLWHVFHDMAV